MDTHEIINGCMEVEKLAASIYCDLIRLFPEEKEFWEDFYDDEKEHLSFLIDAKSLGLIKEMEKISLPPSMTMINKTLKLADNIIKNISASPISFEKALKMVLKLEDTVVEIYTNKLIANLLFASTAE